MKKLQSTLLTLPAIIAAIAISIVTIMGFATLGLAVIGVSFVLVTCATIYHKWQQRQQHNYKVVKEV